MILATYKPDKDHNQAAREAGYTRGFKVGKSIPDVGTYVVSAEDMQSLPDGAVVDISIVRGVFETIPGKQTGQMYAVKGYSIIRMDGYILK
ncbi:MAG: hypothetical protein AAF399_01750 [Bacteroidota bacterium]